MHSVPFWLPSTAVAKLAATHGDKPLRAQQLRVWAVCFAVEALVVYLVMPLTVLAD